jgi:probable HAF family extracellular repeat protein
MKSILTSIAASSLLAALAMAQPAPRYTVRDLGPVGGAAGQPFVITNNGLVSGTAVFPDGTEQAVFWYDIWRGEFGPPAFGGQNSIAFGINESVQAVGQAETSTPDPNSEDFCGSKALALPAKGTTCLPFLWQAGVMTPLPTLGGNNGSAEHINNAGQIAGVAENATTDSTCPATGAQKLQFEPVVWANGQVQQLPTVAGDPDGIAFAINDSGQVVGASGNCTTFGTITLVNLAPLHALLWQAGTATDLGTLGGTGHGNGIEAINLNNKGQVVGNSDLAGDTNFHGFLWTSATGMQDLGTLPGDANSLAIGINDAGDLVGVSLDAKFNPRAFFWRNGVMTDLNSLAPADSPLFLITGCSINSRGQIIGIGVDSAGAFHGYLATPVIGEADGESIPSASQGTSSPIVLSEDVRRLVQRRFGAPLMAPR